MSKGRPMVKNRAAKMAARARASHEGTLYTTALASHAGPEQPLRLVLGLDLDGHEVAWPSRPRRRHSLAVQGPASSGKTTLLTSLANQALVHAKVYVCSNSGRLHVPGAAGHGDGIDSSVELIRTLVNDMRATAAEGRAQLDASVPDKERRGLAHSVRRSDTGALIAALPADRRPPRRVLVVDDFDLLCRNWEWSGRGDIMSSSGPEELVRELVMYASQAMDIRVIVTGESLSRSGTLLGSRFLLGPSTLAEREFFLTADNVGEDPGHWAGLYEEFEFLDDATTHVRLMRS